MPEDEIKTADDFLAFLVSVVPGTRAKIKKADFLFMCNWLAENKNFCNEWPLCVVRDSIKMCSPQHYFDEYKEFLDESLLLDSIKRMTPQDFFINEYGTIGRQFKAIRLYLYKKSFIEDEIFSTEKVYLKNKRFYFTGDFIYGSQTDCENETIKNGGKAAYLYDSGIAYLVVGALGSKNWKFGNYGTKIQNAILKTDARQANIQIIREKDWYIALSSPEAMPEEIQKEKDEHLHYEEFEDGLNTIWEGSLQVEFNYQKIYEEGQPVSLRQLELQKILTKPTSPTFFLYGRTPTGIRTFHIDRIVGDILLCRRNVSVSPIGLLRAFGLENYFSCRR